MSTSEAQDMLEEKARNTGKQVGSGLDTCAEEMKTYSTIRESLGGRERDAENAPWTKFQRI